MKESLIQTLPHLNGALNATSAGLLLCGLWAILKKKDRVLHQKFIVAALSVSIVFLVSYLLRMSLTGPTKFPELGWIRTTYLWILGTHTILAVINVPLVIRTVYLAHKERLPEHRRWARVTFPIWLYVSVTGVVVYWMLYHVAKVG
ncbi:MAG: DUF420 domain-containing protein [Bdellovibrionota bacterium]